MCEQELTKAFQSLQRLRCLMREAETNPAVLAVGEKKTKVAEDLIRVIHEELFHSIGTTSEELFALFEKARELAKADANAPETKKQVRRELHATRRFYRNHQYQEGGINREE
jgi:hypothetical protein